MKTRFCGIDASTRKTGICLLLDGKLEDHRLIDCSKTKDTEIRMKEMAEALYKQLTEYNPSIVYIEDSWNAANVETTKKLTMIMGVTYTWCLLNNAEWHSILPSQWRKYCGINQSKKKRAELKQASIDYVMQEYGIEVGDDEADAISLARGVVNYFNSLDENELFY